jgi:hypothetical protein
MSNNDVKKLAKRFIDEQRRILERHGDGIVRSKYKEAIAGAQKTFEGIISAKSQVTPKD